MLTEKFGAAAQIPSCAAYSIVSHYKTPQRVTLKRTVSQPVSLPNICLDFEIYIPINSVALVRTRTIPTERPPPVGEVSANFCG